MKRTVLSVFIATALFLSIFPATASADTSRPAVWASNAVAYLEEYHLIPNELFANYTAPIRRDEFTAVLMGIYNEACQNYNTFANEPNKFADATSNRYETDIKKANIMGIINGTSDTTFNPDRNITREDTATLIYRFIKLMFPQESAASVKVINDRDQIAGYALSSVEFCMNNGIMNGTGNDTFSPKGLLTRQEAMVLMYNICMQYKIVELGRESAIAELRPVYRGLHEMVYDGYMYVSVQPYPFRFNDSTYDSTVYTLFRTPLDQSQKNKGEILFTHEDEISAYTVNPDNIFFCDRGPDRAVYSTDKDGKDLKLLYKLSRYTLSDFSYMYVQGDWLFVGAGSTLYKMRTNGTCLSILNSGVIGNSFQADGEYIYQQGGSPHGEFVLSRTSINGDITEVLYTNKNFCNSWAGGIFYKNKVYIAILEEGLDWVTGAPLIEINVNTKEAIKNQSLRIGTQNKHLVAGENGVYISDITQDNITVDLNLPGLPDTLTRFTVIYKNITGGSDIVVQLKIEMGNGYTIKYGKYLYYTAVNGQRNTRCFYVYNIETGEFTDIFGNPVK